jgi:hypothetical protein
MDNAWLLGDVRTLQTRTKIPPMDNVEKVAKSLL